MSVDEFTQGVWDCEDGKEPRPNGSDDYRLGYRWAYEVNESATALALNGEKRNGINGSSNKQREL